MLPTMRIFKTSKRVRLEINHAPACAAYLFSVAAGRWLARLPARAKWAFMSCRPLHQRIRLLYLAVCVNAMGSWGTDSSADDWPFFRGPRANGVSAETGWTATWPSAGPKVAWRKNVGVGASSFAAVGDRVLTMGNDDDQDLVWCLDAGTGRVVWKYAYACKFKDHNFEGGTSSTPTIDDGLVYTLAYDGQIHCLKLADGSVVWRKHLVEDFAGRLSSWDYAGSPLVTDQFVIFDTGAEGDSTVALDKTTGRKVWGRGDDLAGYSTPIPFEQAGRKAILVFKARAMVAHDLHDGQELWRIGWKTNYDANASSPSVMGDRVFISSGYSGKRGRGALFQLTATEPSELWINDDIETRMNSAVVYAGYLYCISERASGQLMCVDLRDGKTVWAEPSFAEFGTLMIADGKLVVLDEFGELVIADATPDDYRERARASILDGRCWAMPVLANGRLYARTNKGEMVCLDLRP